MSTGSPRSTGKLGDSGLKTFHDIARTNGLALRKGHTLLANLVAAGEVPLALTTYRYKPEQLKAAGAPIEPLYIPPVVAFVSSIAVTRCATHPNAAVLFHEFMLRDGQEIYARRNLMPTNVKVRPATGRRRTDTHGSRGYPRQPEEMDRAVGQDHRASVMSRIAEMCSARVPHAVQRKAVHRRCGTKVVTHRNRVSGCNETGVPGLQRSTSCCTAPTALRLAAACYSAQLQRSDRSRPSPKLPPTPAPTAPSG